MKYRLRNPIVDAIQWVGGNEQEIVGMVDGGYAEVVGGELVVKINTDSILIRMRVGDWAVKHKDSIIKKSSWEFRRDYLPIK